MGTLFVALAAFVVFCALAQLIFAIGELFYPNNSSVAQLGKYMDLLGKLGFVIIAAFVFLLSTTLEWRWTR